MNHSFNVDVAVAYGIPCAVILEHIWFWIAKNEADGRHLHDGRYWTYSSVKAFSKLFPYLSEKQIRGSLEKLKNAGILITGNYNKEACDRTLWYALTEKGKSICPTGQRSLPSEGNPFAPQGEPIPDINTFIDTDGRNNCGGNTSYDVGNPFGDYDPHHQTNPDTLEAYASSNLRNMTLYNMEELISFRDSLPDELIRHAIDEACGNGVPVYSYVRAILNRYVENGFKTLGDVKAYEAKRKNGAQEPKQYADENDFY